MYYTTSDAFLQVPSSGLEPPRLSAQALNLLRIPFRHEGIVRSTDYANILHLSLRFVNGFIGSVTGFFAELLDNSRRIS